VDRVKSLSSVTASWPDTGYFSMPVNLTLADGIPVPGIGLAPISAGIKSDGSPDLLLIQLPAGSVCAGVFTKNIFCAAPVTVAKKHLQDSGGAVRAMLINSGNANAGTGQPGIDMAANHCATVADALNVSAEQVLGFTIFHWSYRSVTSK